MVRRKLRTLYNYWNTRRELQTRLLVMARIGRWIVPEYRFQWPQLDWWHDAHFNAYLQRFNESSGFNTYRRWTLFQLLRLVQNVPGDTAECGVFEGAGSYLICRANAQNTLHQRHHFLFDSFEGLSAPAAQDGSYWTAGDMSASVETVQKNLAEFTGFSFHKGWIPDRFPDVENRRFAFVHIDVDLYEPTRDSLEFFYPRMSEGGILVCDDYAYSSCPGATEAVNTFLADKPERMLMLPAGGGCLIKGNVTASITA
jgi:O-methyltransferase